MKAPPDIAAKTARIEAVRLREETRLTRLAHSAGVFHHRALSKDLTAMFRDFVATRPPKHSQLKRLTDEVKRMAANKSVQDRRDDTRRKILLGSFMIAQFEHDPKLLAQMQDEIIRFLDQHKDPHVAQGNKLLLGQWTGIREAALGARVRVGAPAGVVRAAPETTEPTNETE